MRPCSYGVAVALTPHIDGYDPRDPFSNGGPQYSWERSAFAERSRTTDTDASGRFAFFDVPDGNYDVYAARDGLAVQQKVVVELAAQTALELELWLPPHGAITGRVRAPAAAVFERVELVALGASGAQQLRRLGYVADFVPRAVLDRQGRYRLEPLVDGPTTVFLALSTAFESGAPWADALQELESVDVHAGLETSSNLDLGAAFPGILFVEVLADGALASGAWLEASRADGARAGGVLDAAGRLRLPLFPGTWKITAKRAGHRLPWGLPVQIEFEPAGEVHVQLAVPGSDPR